MSDPHYRPKEFRRHEQAGMPWWLLPLLFFLALALLGCEDYERQVRVQEWKDRFFNGCMPRKGDQVIAQWVNGSLICKRITPTGRYGETFPHAEVRVAEIGDME